MRRNHNIFANLAFYLAEYNLGKTKSNPSVGCIIIKKDSVISSGITSLNGRPHAEFNALNKNINFKDSIMYVTLEPCTHKGITPPCINIIKKKKIKKVYYCFDDPDQRTYQKAKKILKKKIVKLKKNFFNSKNFYESYYINKKEKIPLVDAKIAISKDYFTINKKSKWITNFKSRNTSHLIRSIYDCIISTSKSINNDNSLLNCRINGLNKLKPDLVVIDRNLNLKKNLKLIRISKKINTYIITCSANKKKISFFKKKIKIIRVKKLNDLNDFNFLFKKLIKLNKKRILIESGLTFLNKLFEFKIIKNLYIFRSGKKLYDKGFNNQNSDFIRKLKLKNKLRINLGDDQLYKERVI